MKILVTGLGVSGKSSFRRLLYEKLQAKGRLAEHFDADSFKELRSETDRSCLVSLPLAFAPRVFYIIEDVHATTAECLLPLTDYDLIFYLQPRFLDYIRLWDSRTLAWFKSGHFSWEKESGWQGSGRPQDWRNVWPILKEFGRQIMKRRAWLKEDYLALESAHANVFLIRSSFQAGQLKFASEL